MMCASCGPRPQLPSRSRILSRIARRPGTPVATTPARAAEFCAAAAGGRARRPRIARADLRAGIRHHQRSYATASAWQSSTGVNGTTALNGVTSDPPFVSRHARLRDGELQRWLQDNKLSHHDPGGEWVRVRECPFCHPTNNKMDNMFKLHLSRSTGAYHCFRCTNKGSYQHFKHRLQMLRQHGVDVGPPDANASRQKAGSVPVPDAQEAGRWKDRLLGSSVAQEYLSKRGLRMDIVRKYGVGLAFHNFKVKDGDGDVDWTRHECFAFPMYGSGNRLVRHKIRGVNEKRHMRLHPTGADWGLFGLDTVPSDAKAVVMTEGEFDAMAVHQATGWPAVSLPNGASSLPPAVLPLLERFEKVYLWMDCDAAGVANRGTTALQSVRTMMQ